MNFIKIIKSSKVRNIIKKTIKNLKFFKTLHFQKFYPKVFYKHNLIIFKIYYNYLILI